MEKLSISHECTDTPTKLTTELTTNILHRLPPKPLARFKCVSKSFLSLITSRSFILSHINRSLSILSNLHITRLGRSTLASLHLSTLDSTTPQTIHLPFITRAPDSDFIGSCHGLLCISDHPNFIALFSPTTRTHRVIPVRVPNQGPESHWVDFGLGYDPSCDDYKVVRVDQLNGPTAGLIDREVRVYSLKGDQWRRLQLGLPHFLAHPKGHGVFLSDSIHWMCTTTPPNCYDLQSNVRLSGGRADGTVYKYLIVGLDLISEGYFEIELPISLRWLKKRVFPKLTLSVLGEKLVVMIEYGENEKRKVDLWVMSNYGDKDSWVKLLTLPYKEKRKSDGTGRVKPLAISNNGKGLEVLFEQNGGYQVTYFWYNVVNGVIKDVQVRGYLPALFEWRGGHPCDYGAVVYGETLVSLDNVGLSYAEPPMDPADDIRDDFNDILPRTRSSFRAHSRQTMYHPPGSDRMLVQLVGFGKRLP